VRDQDDRAPTGGEATDDLVEALDLAGRQRGRRLVEHDQLRVARQCPEDLDLLLLGQRERSDERVRGHREAGGGHEAVELLEQRAPLHEAEAARLLAQEHILGDGALGDDRHLLRDERDAPLQRLAGRPESDGLAAERHLALIGRKDPGHDLAEGGLAGPVLADEGVDGAGVDRDRDVVERPGAAERLADLADLEVDVALAHDALLGDGQPGHSASVRNVSTLSCVTTPPSGRLASTSTPAAGVPVRIAWMNCSVPSLPSVAGACMTVP
jgi:hypothetical protein